MDLESIIEAIKNSFLLSFLLNFLYDAAKLTFAFIIIKLLYEKVYMQWRWGNWKIKVFSSNPEQKKPFEPTQRSLLPRKAREILTDDGEFSIYVKGIISSTGTWLNVDIISDKAERDGLVFRDPKRREIRIDVAKNPPKEKTEKFTKETQEQIDDLEKNMQNVVKILQKKNA